MRFDNNKASQTWDHEWNELGKAQGVSDNPLNKIGKQQAFALTNRLSLEQEWDVMITSDLSPAIETAQNI